MNRTVKKLIGMLSLSLLLFVAAVSVLAQEDGDEDVQCCSSGAACNPGQACCRKKAPAAPCSEAQPYQCVNSPGDCQDGEPQ
jgi:hypothetical protein